jgi:hypothetical protein
MVFEHTQAQSTDEQQRALQLSLHRSQPPAQVPGYDARKFLGAGAYGEVWVAVDRTTGRQVAIKFYAHRGGLDWSLLSREVEKLAFLSADRYVVQLLDVGWDADPPYYVMEYIERGSLEELLKRRGKLSANLAVDLFREIAIGLLHAHGKGVLHCDLKPANVLLDQDQKPRLADFGQSRLSHEQTPALGTLFYMAPEQASLNAVPDVRWDVYALGCLLYCMLTGAPPYRNNDAITEIETAADLDERLLKYREVIERSPRPAAHRSVAGVDRALVEIIDNCLAVDRARRYANIQAVLDALDAREQRRARRPLVVLGAIGPALILAVIAIFAWRSFEAILDRSDAALKERALESNRFAAAYVAKTVANELDRRYRSVEQLGRTRKLRDLVQGVLEDPQLKDLIEQLNSPQLTEEDRMSVRAEFLVHPARTALQRYLEEIYADQRRPDVGSWFVNDRQGLQLARAPEKGDTIGRNYGWRTYFHGGNRDRQQVWRPSEDQHIKDTTLSQVYRSEATKQWTVAVTTPIKETMRDDDMVGIVGMSVEVGRFAKLQAPRQNHYAVLIDWRDGPYKGLILEHPLFDKVLEDHGQLPERFSTYRVSPRDLPDTLQKQTDYVDPMSRDELGEDFDRRWLARMETVSARDGETGWRVIVQESYQAAIGETLDTFKANMWTSGLWATGVIAVLSSALWAFVLRMLAKSTRRLTPAPNATEPALQTVA